MMVDLAQQMTTVKHEQEYMEVRERIHTYVTPYRYHMNLLYQKYYIINI